MSLKARREQKGEVVGLLAMAKGDKREVVARQLDDYRYTFPTSTHVIFLFFHFSM